MTAGILFVCSQNICRSPYLAAVVGAGLDRGEALEVSSRGTDAEDGFSMCEVARKRLPVEAADRGMAHRSQSLTLEDVAAAALVLTATTNQRSAVARIDPAARGRTFSVREFMRLAGAGAPIREAYPDAGLDEVVALLHARRGLIVASRAPRSPWARRRSGVRALDIPDLHRERLAAHEGLFADLDVDADEILKIVVPHVVAG